MMRLAGFSMIGFSCCGLGVWYAWQLRQRVDHLHDMNRIMELLVSLLQYGKSTLPECCRQLATRTEEPYSRAFAEVYRQMTENKGNSFATVYGEIMGRTLKEIGALKEQDREIFLQCVLQQGCGDTETGIRLLKRQQELLRERITGLEAENRGKSRMAVGLGTLGGLLLIIILL